NFPTNNTRRLGELQFRLPQKHPTHESIPHRRCAADASDVDHGCVVGVANPYPCNQIGSVADDPVITEVGGGSGFGGGGTTNVEGAVLSKSGEAGVVVAQDVGNQVGNPFIN